MKKLLVLIAFVALVGCEEDLPQDGVNDGQREAMLRDLATNVIAPGFVQFGEQSGALLDAVQAFIASPNQATLDVAQDKWVEIGRTWKRLEFYQQGRLDQETDDSLIHKIDLGAVDRNLRNALVPRESLELAIAGVRVEEPSGYYVEDMPAQLQGLFAIEEILFGTSDEAVIAQFATHADSLKRKRYLEGLAVSLTMRASGIHDSWSQSSGATFAAFVKGSGTDLNSSLGMLMNDIVYLAEMMKNQKIGRPLGYLSNQIPQPDSVEARRSKQSLAFFIENLDGIEEAFTTDAGGRIGIGIDSLLNFMDAKVGDKNLSEAVKTQLATMRTLAGSLGNDLPNAVRTNKMKVDELFTECLVLLKLLKVDIVSQLGVMITTLEGDGD